MSEAVLGRRPVAMTAFLTSLVVLGTGVGYVGWHEVHTLGCRYHQAREGSVRAEGKYTDADIQSGNVRIVTVHRPDKPKGAVIKIDDCAPVGTSTFYVAGD